jgi:hypothetical protein
MGTQIPIKAETGAKLTVVNREAKTGAPAVIV